MRLGYGNRSRPGRGYGITHIFATAPLGVPVCCMGACCAIAVLDIMDGVCNGFECGADCSGFLVRLGGFIVLVLFGGVCGCACLWR